MTYLQLVNRVLTRLRENSVATVSATAYSSLIGTFVNDAKRQVEDAWKWNCLHTTITVTTSSGTSTYTVTGSGLHHKNETINDTSNDSALNKKPLQWILDQQQLSNVANNRPSNYAWNGSDGTDSRIELFPTPDGTYTLKVNLYVPQTELAADGDVITISPEAVIMGAYARALVERGEDGGLSSSEAYGLYKNILSDHIALDAHRMIENDCWEAN